MDTDGSCKLWECADYVKNEDSKPITEMLAIYPPGEIS